MANIYFLRHGQSTSNVKNTFSGMKDDAHLTAEGEAQAAAAGQSWKETGIRLDRIVASPLERTLATARIFATAVGFDPANIETDARFAEYDMGALTGQPRTDVTSAQLISAQGAEAPQAFMARVKEALAELEGQEGEILLVSHAGVGRMIRCIKEGVDPATFYDLPAYPNATVIEL